MNIPLDPIGGGVYTAKFIAALPGVYRCRVRAEGYTDTGNRFTREKTLTAATYIGNYGTTPPDDTLCNLLHCLTSEQVITRRAAEALRGLGIDIAALRKCIDEHCPEPKEHVPPKPRKPAPQPPKLNIKSEPSARPVKVPKSKPTKMRPSGKPVTFPRVIHMFSPDEDMKMPMESMPKSRKKKPRK